MPSRFAVACSSLPIWLDFPLRICRSYWGHVDMDDVRQRFALPMGVRDAFFRAMTSAAARLAEDIDALGPTRAEEVRAAQDRIAGLSNLKSGKCQRAALRRR